MSYWVAPVKRLSQFKRVTICIGGILIVALGVFVLVKDNVDAPPKSDIECTNNYCEKRK